MSAYNYESFGQCDIDAPDFSLADLDGNLVSLSSFAGKKHVLLEFGSIT